jgi:hypothetical protein
MTHRGFVVKEFEEFERFESLKGLLCAEFMLHI